MKPALLLVTVVSSVLLSACCSQTTLENRRDMYFPQKVNGPYTRMVKDGIPTVKTETTVVVETTSASYGK